MTEGAKPAKRVAKKVAAKPKKVAIDLDDFKYLAEGLEMVEGTIQGFATLEKATIEFRSGQEDSVRVTATYDRGWSLEIEAV